MRSEDRVPARRQLDKRLSPLRHSESLARPPRGWIRTIREALGMTSKQLGARIAVSQPRVTRIEQAESDGTITLETLRRAAQAMDCKLVYAFVPRVTLKELVEERARSRARSLLEAIRHSMALEDQRADADTESATSNSSAANLQKNQARPFGRIIERSAPPARRRQYTA